MTSVIRIEVSARIGALDENGKFTARDDREVLETADHIEVFELKYPEVVGAVLIVAIRRGLAKIYQPVADLGEI